VAVGFPPKGWNHSNGQFASSSAPLNSFGDRQVNFVIIFNKFCDEFNGLSYIHKSYTHKFDRAGQDALNGI